MSNKQQTSVDWLIEYLTNESSILISAHYDALEQAKAMHNKEVVDFVEDWYHNGPLLGVDVLVSTSIEKHYNETFGGNNDQQ